MMVAGTEVQAGQVESFGNKEQIDEGRFLIWLEGASGALQGDTHICRGTIVERLWVIKFQIAVFSKEEESMRV